MPPFRVTGKGVFFLVRFKTRTHKVLAIGLNQKRQEYYGKQEGKFGWHRLFFPLFGAKKWGQELQQAPGPRWTGGLAAVFSRTWSVLLR